MSRGVPRRPLHVCFVCTGNICRSPMAAAVFRGRLRAQNLADEVRVSSAGIGPWHVGEPADPRARAALEAAGYDSEHVAAQVGPRHLQADLLLASDRGHLVDLRELAPEPDRVRLLRSFDPSAPPGAEVPDPYYGSGDGFADVLAMIERSVSGLMDWVRKNR
ncbi:protein-tyrosine-phosphatase [Saccharomonospora marina XMU15]|uniref:protein-tyrosine-phosphatase n=1 Tax=Saccharomonospora marina XMU15 TaxID=882083 RepID=H5XB71_9PSEU|nr:low molecular weight protein-tyrosine-phosphatase [Saccharomonospora marina]EHR49306.1 protein-tyrosine-phosphatase [Saccharomonospora marina XMU15]